MGRVLHLYCAYLHRLTLAQVEDSFDGFRSDHVHFSLSITSPVKRGQSASSTPGGDSNDGASQNSLHLSPLLSSHFWSWWSTFDSTLSLPIRTGSLFPSAQAPSKKFGKATATIKYRFSISPLFIAHTYRQERRFDWAKGQTTVIGIKGRVDNFNLDMHQRAQSETHIHRTEGREPLEKTVVHKVFYQAELDCEGLDCRTISATHRVPEKESFKDVVGAQGEDDELQFASNEGAKLSDEDHRQWYDASDFTDVGIRYEDPDPILHVHPIGQCPRFTYYRQPPRKEDEEAAEVKKSKASKKRPAPIATSKFGDEQTHDCCIGHAAGATSCFS